MQQTVGEHMAALGVGTQLNLVHSQKIATHAIGHRFDRAHPILGAVGYDAFFAGDQRHHRRAPGADNPVINFTCQQAQRQTNDAGAMAQHPLNGVMGFSGIGRAQYSRDPGFGRHDSPR